MEATVTIMMLNKPEDHFKRVSSSPFLDTENYHNPTHHNRGICLELLTNNEK